MWTCLLPAAWRPTPLTLGTFQTEVQDSKLPRKYWPLQVRAQLVNNQQKRGTFPSWIYCCRPWERGCATGNYVPTQLIQTQFVTDSSCRDGNCDGLNITIILYYTCYVTNFQSCRLGTRFINVELHQNTAVLSDALLTHRKKRGLQRLRICTGKFCRIRKQ